MIRCYECCGRGWTPGTARADNSPCPLCRGIGEVPDRVPIPPGHVGIVDPVLVQRHRVCRRNLLDEKSFWHAGKHIKEHEED